MVDEQLRGRGVKDERVLEVMGEIPREKFVPKNLQNQTYDDSPLPIRGGQTISQPYIVALMTQLLELKGLERVLEIGTGSGYQAAILGKLVSEVYSIERNPVLASQSRGVLKKLGCKNVKVLVGDGFLGYPKAAPYQGIILTAAPQEVPPALVEQLDEGGRLVLPLGPSFEQRLFRLTKVRGELKKEDFGFCSFVPLLRGIER